MLEPISGPWVFYCARWRKDLLNIFELARDCRAWSASILDVVNSIGDNGFTLQVQVRRGLGESLAVQDNLIKKALLLIQKNETML